MDIDYSDNFSPAPWPILNEETLWLVVVREIFAEEFEIQF